MWVQAPSVSELTQTKFSVIKRSMLKIYWFVKITVVLSCIEITIIYFLWDITITIYFVRIYELKAR
jgi:hypothetical protein